VQYFETSKHDPSRLVSQPYRQQEINSANADGGLTIYSALPMADVAQHSGDNATENTADKIINGP